MNKIKRRSFFTLFVIILLSGISFSQEEGEITLSEEAKISSHINFWVSTLFCFSLYIAILLSSFVIMLSGFRYMTSDTASGRREARKRMIYAILVLAFIVVACPLVNFIIYGSEVSEFFCNCPPKY